MPKSRKIRNIIDSETASRILRRTPVQKAFFFFTGTEHYTGQFAQSLSEFYDKISYVPLESLDFHIDRGDFEKWIREILNDSYLADRISRIDQSIRGEKLRTSLKRIVKRHINQLKMAREK